MDLVSGRLLWPAVDGLPHAYPRLHGDAHADVVVLGGGVTGALVAHALAADDMDVLVLDKREVGWGSDASANDEDVGLTWKCCGVPVRVIGLSPEGFMSHRGWRGKFRATVRGRDRTGASSVPSRMTNGSVPK